MGITVSIEIDGVETVLGNLDKIEASAQDNVSKQLSALTRDATDYWEENTPKRTGRLAGGDTGEATDLTATFSNGVYYYKWVNVPGHMTPAGWHTRHGYRPAHRRSHVPGKPMTETLIQFLVDNILTYLSKFLED